MPKAAWLGTTVGFVDYYNSVFLEKEDGTATVITRATFEHLYYRIDLFTAALKSDCIEFAYNDPMIDLFTQPSWYIELVEDGIIRSDCGMEQFYPSSGEEIDINPDSVILRNFQGDFRYMDLDEFSNYYTFTGSEFIE